MSKKIYTYIEIKSLDNANIVKRMDVSDKSPRTVDKIEAGININLDHTKFYTFSFDSETKLPEIK